MLLRNSKELSKKSSKLEPNIDTCNVSEVLFNDHRHKEAV